LKWWSKLISYGGPRIHTDKQKQDLRLLFYSCASVPIRG
jgi:hypothetical protein